MAETMGFEPMIPLSRYAHLANECLQPLGHVSVASEAACAVYARGRPQFQAPRVGHSKAGCSKTGESLARGVEGRLYHRRRMLMHGAT
jgi:hypothetical protein